MNPSRVHFVGIGGTGMGSLAGLLHARGIAVTGTGPDMSPNGNLAEHLIECLNIVCGRLLREGDEIDHPGAIQPNTPRRAEVVPAPRWWEHGPRSRVGDFGLVGELDVCQELEAVAVDGDGGLVPEDCNVVAGDKQDKHL